MVNIDNPNPHANPNTAQSRLFQILRYKNSNNLVAKGVIQIILRQSVFLSITLKLNKPKQNLATTIISKTYFWVLISLLIICIYNEKCVGTPQGSHPWLKNKIRACSILNENAKFYYLLCNVSVCT